MAEEQARVLARARAVRAERTAALHAALDQQAATARAQPAADATADPVTPTAPPRDGHRPEGQADDLPPGVVRVPTAEVARLREQAEAPQRIAAAGAQRHREKVIRAALEAGKITTHQGRAWARQLEVDPEAEEALAAIPDGASGVPLGDAIGYVGSTHQPPSTPSWPGF